MTHILPTIQLIAQEYNLRTEMASDINMIVSVLSLSWALYLGVFLQTIKPTVRIVGA